MCYDLMGQWLNESSVVSQHVHTSHVHACTHARMHQRESRVFGCPQHVLTAQLMPDRHRVNGSAHSSTHHTAVQNKTHTQALQRERGALAPVAAAHHADAELPCLLHTHPRSHPRYLNTIISKLQALQRERDVLVAAAAAHPADAELQAAAAASLSRADATCLAAGVACEWARMRLQLSDNLSAI